ncbi:hypothetical protein [Sinorhizobium sp. BG8]|uniref:hypothetical protein n=1 Tax=Sinorhizobium sp. BG8 TaxID=2613773 RepID=UPI00193D96D8|nr:hypothetical protein [Sinorhizobium sp. BG8]QRM54806.1 hypothetical protein F3Y30_09810 [Sinorhizobium sp. BG8]
MTERAKRFAIDPPAISIRFDGGVACDVGVPGGKPLENFRENEQFVGKELIRAPVFFISPFVSGEVAEWSKALPC